MRESKGERERGNDKEGRGRMGEKGGKVDVKEDLNPRNHPN